MIPIQEGWRESGKGPESPEQAGLVERLWETTLFSQGRED